MSTRFGIPRGWRLCIILAVVTWNVILAAVFPRERQAPQADDLAIVEALGPAMTDPVLEESCKKTLVEVAADLAHAMTALRYPDGFAHYFPTRGDFERAVDQWAMYRESADTSAAKYLDMHCPSGPLVWASVIAFETSRTGGAR